jgi:vacuolar-type H+-ATPase subunit I/STV1
MMRMSTVVLDHDQRAVLRELGKLGAVELTRTAASENTAPLPPADVSAELSRYDRLLSRGHELHRLLEIPFYIKTSSTGAMTLVKAEAKQHRLEQRAAELVERREQLRQQLTELETISGQMIAYSGLRLPLDKIGRLNFLHCAIGDPAGAPAGHRLDDATGLERSGIRPSPGWIRANSAAH